MNLFTRSPGTVLVGLASLFALLSFANANPEFNGLWTISAAERNFTSARRLAELLVHVQCHLFRHHPGQMSASSLRMGFDSCGG